MTNLFILSNKIRLQDGLYSLNDLHRAAGSEKKHQPNYFLSIEQTQNLITEIEQSNTMYIGEVSQSRDYGFKNLDSNKECSKPLRTKRGGRNSGTWVCKELVYAYAMWISPQFHLQVIRAFDAQQQMAIAKAPAPLDYQRILLTIENGQTTRTQALALDDMVTSFDKLPNVIRESMAIQPYQLLEIAKAANEKLSPLIHKY
jgi:hypothetical protein